MESNPEAIEVAEIPAASPRFRFVLPAVAGLALVVSVLFTPAALPEWNV